MEEKGHQHQAPNEQLPGKTTGSVYLIADSIRVSTRVPGVRHFTFPAYADGSGRTRVPVRIKVASDDMPDDVPEVVRDCFVETEVVPRKDLVTR